MNPVVIVYEDDAGEVMRGPYPAGVVFHGNSVEDIATNVELAHCRGPGESWTISDRDDPDRITTHKGRRMGYLRRFPRLYVQSITTTTPE